jgi:hypothetical protein
MDPTPRRRRHVAPLALVCALAGSATPDSLPAGTTLVQARHGWIAPTGEYALPGGGTRLEFARGAFGKETTMLDFDASGTLVGSQQALTEQNFAHIVAGMPAAEVRMRLGRPAQVFAAGWQEKFHVWNYRFAGGDCVWFQVSISDSAQRVTSAGIGTDPACDGPDSREGTR